MSDKRAELLEMFSSIQGEGLLVGLRQVFLRFYGCNLECAYCDTNFTSAPPFFKIESTPGRRDFLESPNPVALELIISHLEAWDRGWPGIHHSLSITGGEPLLNDELLLEWLPELRKFFPIFLETNGVLHAALSRLIGLLDHISMDIKIPSTSGCLDQWDLHREFLRIASQKDVFVKVVISDETEEWEIERACMVVSHIDPQITVILQPVTLENSRVGISYLKMLEFQEISYRYLKNVRIIPQTHKFIGLI